MLTTKLLQQGTFKSELDLLALDCIDWNRLMGYWDNTAEALQTAASYLIDTAIYKVIQFDLCEAPERADWPGWRHVGHHPELGKLYWNWFHQMYNEERHYNATIFFSDSPDFHGTLTIPGWSKAKFYGDIGKVSAPTFIRTLQKMDAHDIWISVLDTQTMVTIESFISTRELWLNTVSTLLASPASVPEQEVTLPIQLQLFEESI